MTMKEAKFLAPLMPTHPDLEPIVQEVRDKYQLHEVDPDGEPITEIFLNDEAISLQSFRQEIKALVSEKTNYLPEPLIKLYRSGKIFVDKPIGDIPELAMLPDSMKEPINALYIMSQTMTRPIINAVDKHFESVADMLYVYLLTGETEEIPADWISIVTTAEVFGNTLIFAIANQIADPEVTIQQFRQLHRKTFGKHLPKLTKNAVSTAYYLQLEAAGKPKDYIVEEFIRINKYSLPRDRTSQRYLDVYKKYERRLNKRIQRSKAVLSVLIEDKK